MAAYMQPNGGTHRLQINTFWLQTCSHLAAFVQPFGCMYGCTHAAKWLHNAATFLAAFFCHRLHLAALVPSTAEKAAKILAGSQPTQPVDKGIWSKKLFTTG